MATPAARIGVFALVLLSGGWMLFDGARALVVGDYVTPSAGRFAGRLGPWSGIVEAVGIAPRSTAMKWIFVVYGALFVVAGAAFAARPRAARTALVVTAALGLWYLPFGTALNLGAIGIALLASDRPGGRIRRMRDELRTLAEKDRIAETIHAMFLATDARDWEDVESCFADRVRFDTTSLAGGEPMELTPREITEAWDRGLAPILHVHHQIGNLRIRLGGDRATAHCYGTAYHFRPVASGRNVRTFVGSYDFRLQLEDGQWRIDDFRYHHKFLEGNPDLDREAPAAT